MNKFSYILATINIPQIAFILVAFAILLGGAFYFISDSTETPEVFVAKDIGEPSVPLSGVLFLGANINLGTTSLQTVVAYDVSSQGGGPRIYDEPFIGLPSEIIFEDRFATSTFYLKAFTPASYKINNDEAKLALHRFSNGSITHVYKAGNSASDLSISPNKKYLAYSELKDEDISETEKRKVENWNVIVVDTETGNLSYVVREARLPNWSSDGSKLLLQQSSGIRVFDTRTGQIEPILTSVSSSGKTNPINTQTSFDLTMDDKTLVVASPYMNRVDLFSIDVGTQETEFFSQLVTRDVRYFTPIFSPDGEYYAVYAVNENGTEPRIEIRQTGKEEILRNITLENVDPESAVLTDWVKR